MSPVPHFAHKRDKVEGEIVAALEFAGATVLKLDDFDLLVGYNGHNYVFEVKSSKGRLTANQKRWWGIRWAGQREIVRSIRDALCAIGAART